MKKIMAMISGTGSNLAALIAATQTPSYGAKIVKIISNRTNAAGLRHGYDHNIPTFVADDHDYPSRETHEAAILAELDRDPPDFICLAGYMRILSANFIQNYSGRILNIHPSLLPFFKGRNTHQRALDARVLIHGCSVHFVTKAMDAGPVIAQAIVPVIPDDRAEELAARILSMEHKLYPMALHRVVRGDVFMVNEYCSFAPGVKPEPLLISTLRPLHNTWR